MVGGLVIGRNYVGSPIVDLCGIRSGFMGGSVGQGKDTWLWWHGICCSLQKRRDEVTS
jgi:hypothetical protein